MDITILTTGEKIRRARAEKGITMKNMSCKTISVTKLSFIENDKYLPTEEEAEYICSVLGLDPETILMTLEEQVGAILEKEKELKLEELEELYKKVHFNELDGVRSKVLSALAMRYLNLDLTEKLRDIIPEYWHTVKYNDSTEERLQFVLIICGFYYSTKELDILISIIKNLPPDLHLVQEMTGLQKACLACVFVKAAILQNEEEAMEGWIPHLYELPSDFKRDTRFITKALGVLGKLKVYDSEGMKEFDTITEKCVDPRNRADLYLIRSRYYLNREMLAESLTDLKKSVALMEAYTSLYGITSLEYIVGFLLETGGTALLHKIPEIFNLYLAKAIELSDDRHVEYAYWIKALMKCHENDLSSAETCLNVCIGILEKNSRPALLKQRYMAMGDLMLKTGRIREAIRNYKDAEEIMI